MNLWMILAIVVLVASFWHVVLRRPPAPTIFPATKFVSAHEFFGTNFPAPVPHHSPGKSASFPAAKAQFERLVRDGADPNEIIAGARRFRDALADHNVFDAAADVDR
jgi:hypothetical protein